MKLYKVTEVYTIKVDRYIEAESHDEAWDKLEHMPTAEFDIQNDNDVGNYVLTAYDVETSFHSMEELWNLD